MSEFSVPLSQIVEKLGLQKVYVAENYEETQISTVEINRPGLELTGYFEFFDNKRIQVLGNTEFAYLGRFGSEAQRMVIESIFSFGPPAVIICREIEPSNVILESAKLHKVSIFATDENTSDLTAQLVQYLNRELAPRITRHGVLVEVYGEGCLLTGDSGVGKSETAIELIKRGHRLVADDAVEILRRGRDTQNKRQHADRPVAAEHTPLYRAQGHRYHQRPPALRYGRGQAEREDRYGSQPRAVGQHQGL